jgi:SpoVK/Ycf46/Vps4 family AAA+-type ATPase
MAATNLPKWWNTLQQQHGQGIGRVFILYNNVNDIVYYPCSEEQDSTDLYYISPHPFRDMLMHILAVEGGFGPILYYSPTSPLSLFYLNKDRIHSHTCVDLKKLEKELKKIHLKEVSQEKDDEKTPFWDNFAKKVGTEQRNIQEKLDVLFNIEPLLEQIFPEHKLVLILDFFEKITTQQEGGSDFQTEEIIRRWALSDRLKRTENLVIGMTVDFESLPRLIRTSDSRIQSIEVPVPGPEERRKFLSYWRNPSFADRGLAIKIAGPDKGGFEPVDDEGKKEVEIQKERETVLANITKGFRLLNLDTMCRTANTEEYGSFVNEKLLKKQKAALISEESVGLLEEITLKHTFKDIGGLEYATEYFRKVAANIPLVAQKEGKKRSVPKGILLVGPPGTGKTILAEALAGAASITLVKLGDIQASFIGQSEQNMTRALNLLKELAPVVVFVDEIDQSLGRRSTGTEGDSGVSRRLFGKILEFMGDNKNRGKVLWVAASNRPDILDEAMISRFDTVMAILPPYALEECKKIIKIMENRVEEISYSTDFIDNLDGIATKLSGMPGRAVETLIRKAADLAVEEGKIAEQEKETAVDVSECKDAPNKAIGLDNEKVFIESRHVNEAIKLYKPNTNIKEIDAQTIRAIMAVNFTDLLPDDPNLYPSRLRPFIKRALTEEPKSNQPLLECLNEIFNPDGTLYDE